MIIADKIVSLRKRAGWSQEELAEKLGVTRQSVSKWEGAQSVPDMDKVVSMSRLFGVTTDYLLKDELEEEPFETEYGVDGMVLQRQQEYKDTNTRLTTVGVVLCVLAAVPLFAVMCIDGADLLYVGAVCALLALVAVGCLALVTTGVYQGAMEQLLEEGDYTRPQKKHHKLRGTVTMIYWLAATAVFLLYTYGPHGNGQPRYSWIIWAVAGVLYAAVMGIVRIISRG